MGHYAKSLNEPGRSGFVKETICTIISTAVAVGIKFYGQINMIDTFLFFCLTFIIVYFARQILTGIFALLDNIALLLVISILLSALGYAGYSFLYSVYQSVGLLGSGLTVAMVIALMFALVGWTKS